MMHPKSKTYWVAFMTVMTVGMLLILFAPNNGFLYASIILVIFWFITIIVQSYRQKRGRNDEL
ncbi:MAG TPA: hypothetical protein VK067_06675 [Pseudogracilibacillus sp.]|nr:hypothetical protein [Pseudogracilibacillus sp.]